jgi:hypothetical protein
MKPDYKRTTYISLAVAVLSLLVTGAVLAGNMDSPGAPTAAGSQMYTLEQIHDRLTTGAEDTKMTTFTEPGSGPGSTMNTLDEIMAAAPALDNTNGATGTHVLAGQTFWGLTASQWATQTGTMPNNGAGSTIVPTTTDQSVAAGYWPSANMVQGDSDLVAGNIAQGVNLFGVDGSGILASGNATPGQVLNGVTFSNSSGADTGTMPNNGAGGTITPTTTSQNIAAGYWSSINTVLGDADLDQWNIRSGVTIFGVTGKCHRLPATGQTTEYSSGDDGTYQYGCRPLVVPQSGYPGDNFSRTDLPWSSSSGTGFTDNGDGTVTDNVTGLIWLKNANCFGTQTWENALANANTLASGSCDLSDGSSVGDWRLPNLNELRSLIDPDRSKNPALPTGHPFTGVQLPSYYWSSTSYTDDPLKVWCVALYDGYVFYNYKSHVRIVWPVRSGQ